MTSLAEALKSDDSLLIDYLRDARVVKYCPHDLLEDVERIYIRSRDCGPRELELGLYQLLVSTFRHAVGGADSDAIAKFGQLQKSIDFDANYDPKKGLCLIRIDTLSDSATTYDLLTKYWKPTKKMVLLIHVGDIFCKGPEMSNREYIHRAANIIFMNNALTSAFIGVGANIGYAKELCRDWHPSTAGEYAHPVRARVRTLLILWQTAGSPMFGLSALTFYKLVRRSILVEFL